MPTKLLPKNKKLIVANWKMNPENIFEARKIFSLLKKSNFNLKKVVAVICPPVIFLNELSTGYRGKKFIFGSQDVSLDNKKKYTGETGISILKTSGVRLVIVGHAERRALGETNQSVAVKIKNVISAGLTPVLCVGENRRDLDGTYLRFVEEQLHESLKKVSRKDIEKVILAYEPIWAIGKGRKAISTHELHQMTLFIKKILSAIYNKKVAMNVPILYGGSIDADNCEEIINKGEVSGLLVGRASLNPYIFSDILKKVSSV